MIKLERLQGYVGQSIKTVIFRKNISQNDMSIAIIVLF